MPPMNMPKVPNVPNVSMPRVSLPFVDKKNSTNRNDTSYAMDSSALHNSRTAANGDEEQAGNINNKRSVINGDGFVDEPARHQRTWEEKEKEESFSLEEDLYSLMYLCQPFSVAMGVSISVFLLQLFILGLIFADLTNDAPLYQEIVFFPLTVPIDVKTTVAVAQFVSLVVATIKEEDIFVSLKALIIVGHDERVSVRFPGATPFKWWLANTFRFITGLGNVVVSFYFIVGSDNVLDIFESFAALEFVSYIDNMVFKLARWGYTGKGLQRMTIKVESVQMENRRERGRWWAALVVLFLSLTIIPLIVCWSQVRTGQINGFYLEQAISPSVVVRFGDERLSSLSRSTRFNFAFTQRNLTSFDSYDPPVLQYAYFSGSYKISHVDGKLDRLNGRPVYFERNATACKNDPACGMFYYCEEIETWVFTIRALGSARQELDKCKWGWLAQSQQTEVYSLEEVPESRWKVWTGVTSETTVTVTSDSCNLDSDCSLNGVCEDDTCICFENWQGRTCNIPSPYCPALMFVNYGKSSKEYLFDGPFELASNDDGSVIEVYDRPMYYRTANVTASTCSSRNMYELYLYAGRRWYLTYWCEELLVRYIKDGEIRIEENLHAFWDNVLGLDLKWFSELTESHTGTGLPMYEVRDSYSTGSLSKSFGISFFSEGTFECLDVPCIGDLGACGRKGTCEEYSFESIEANTTKTFHKCTCRDYYGGVYCQFSPNGRYTKEHFKEFQSNANAGLELSPYGYQERYWQPWLAAGVAANATGQEDPINGDAPAESNSTPDTANIFSNRSSPATEEGEL